MWNNKLIKSGLLLAGLCLLSVSAATGQIIYGQPTSGEAGFIYTHWTISDSLDINQFMIPLSGFVPLKDNLEIRFSAASASSKINVLDYDLTLSGVSDVRLQVNQSLAEDRLLLSLGVNLPTGKKELSFGEELIVLQALSLNFLNFPIRHLGEGFGVNLMAGGASMLGEAQVSGAVMYQYNGTYKPYDIGDEHNPGDQFSLIASAGFNGDKHAVTIGGVYSIFGADKLEDRKIFSRAPLFSLNLSGLFGEGQYRFGGDIGMLFRGRNASYDSTESKIEQLKAYGNEFLMAGRMVWMPDALWTVTPSIEIHAVGESEYEMEGATVYGFGTEVGRNIGSGVELGFGLKYFTGSFTEIIDLDLKGYQITGALRTSFK